MIAVPTAKRHTEWLQRDPREREGVSWVHLDIYPQRVTVNFGEACVPEDDVVWRITLARPDAVRACMFLSSAEGQGLLKEACRYRGEDACSYADEQAALAAQEVLTDRLLREACFVPFAEEEAEYRIEALAKKNGYEIKGGESDARLEVLAERVERDALAADVVLPIRPLEALRAIRHAHRIPLWYTLLPPQLTPEPRQGHRER